MKFERGKIGNGSDFRQFVDFLHAVLLEDVHEYLKKRDFIAEQVCAVPRIEHGDRHEAHQGNGRECKNQSEDTAENAFLRGGGFRRRVVVCQSRQFFLIHSVDVNFFFGVIFTHNKKSPKKFLLITKLNKSL